jgi:hypothetical protein
LPAGALAIFLSFSLVSFSGHCLGTLRDAFFKVAVLAEAFFTTPDFSCVLVLAVVEVDLEIDSVISLVLLMVEVTFPFDVDFNPGFAT